MFPVTLCEQKTLDLPIRGLSRADWQLIQPIRKLTEVIKLLWAEQRGGNTTVTNQSHNWQPSWPIKKPLIHFPHFLSLPPPHPKRGGGSEGGEEKMKLFFSAKNMLQPRRFHRTAPQTQTAADRLLIFTAPSAADTKLWLAVWLWNTQSQHFIYCIFTWGQIHSCRAPSISLTTHAWTSEDSSTNPGLLILPHALCSHLWRSETNLILCSTSFNGLHVCTSNSQECTDDIRSFPLVG